MTSTDTARAVVRALIESGVREIVIAPGSRNAPLSFASYDAAAAGLVRLHTRIDERSAGFLALGLTRNGNRAAVMCTSGTGVANLHPALLEAAHSGLPLVAVTADRPARLRGTNANQTTDQVDVFGRLVETVDVADRTADLAAALGRLQPVHLNVQLDEPLLPEAPWTPDVTRGDPPRRSTPMIHVSLDQSLRTVVVAGDDAGPQARQLAESGGWPLLAEPSSGSRTGENALRCYRLLLDTELGRSIERVVVCGHPTLSRPVTRLLGRDDVTVIDTPTGGVWTERPFPVDERLIVVPHAAERADPAWLESWRTADAAVARRLDALLAAEPDLTPLEVAGVVARSLPPGGLLVVGASSPIRDLDLMVPRYEVGARRKVVANRGLSGIDGTVSTAIGAALARPESTRAIALMGDVTFLHDANGLILGPTEPVPDLSIVVVNDDGGAIFSMLEQGDPSYADRFDTLFGTPHHVDLASLCAATRTPHWRVDSAAELEHALATPNGGLEVVEVVVRRDNRRDLDARVRALTPW